MLRSALKDKVTIENVQEKWPEVTDMSRMKGDMPKTAEEMTALYFRALEKFSHPSTENLSRMKLVDFEIPSTEFTYDSKDTMLYALGGEIRISLITEIIIEDSYVTSWYEHYGSSELKLLVRAFRKLSSPPHIPGLDGNGSSPSTLGHSRTEHRLHKNTSWRTIR